MKFQCQWVSVSAAVRRSRPILNGCIRKINKVVDKLVHNYKQVLQRLVLPAKRTVLKCQVESG